MTVARSPWIDHVGVVTDTEGVSTVLDGVSCQAVSLRVRARRLLALRTDSGRPATRSGSSATVRRCPA